MDRELEIGNHVIFTDAKGRDHHALVQCIHDTVNEDGVWTTKMPHAGEAPDRQEDPEKLEEFLNRPYRNNEFGPLINLVIVSGDERRQDSYGRQTEHVTSLVHKSDGVHGFYWRWPDEDKNPRRPSHS